MAAHRRTCSRSTAHGQFPVGDLLLVGSNLYGMTSAGGANGDGTIFSEPITGGTPTILFSFDGAHGSEPLGDLTLIGSTLYGMTKIGGTSSDGTIFSIPLIGGTPTILHSFSGADGANPDGSLSLAGLTLYGMTQNGGASGDGTVFALILPEPSSLALLSFARSVWRRSPCGAKRDARLDGFALASHSRIQFHRASSPAAAGTPARRDGEIADAP